MPVIIDGEIVPDDDPRAVQRRLLEGEPKAGKCWESGEEGNGGFVCFVSG